MQLSCTAMHCGGSDTVSTIAFAYQRATLVQECYNNMPTYTKSGMFAPEIRRGIYLNYTAKSLRWGVNLSLCPAVAGVAYPFPRERRLVQTSPRSSAPNSPVAPRRRLGSFLAYRVVYDPPVALAPAPPHSDWPLFSPEPEYYISPRFHSGRLDFFHHHHILGIAYLVMMRFFLMYLLVRRFSSYASCSVEYSGTKYDRQVYVNCMFG